MPTEERWDVKDGGKIFSYLSFDQIKRLVANGLMKEDHFIWHSGLSGWRKAGEQEELKPFFKKAKKE